MEWALTIKSFFFIANYLAFLNVFIVIIMQINTSFKISIKMMHIFVIGFHQIPPVYITVACI